MNILCLLALLVLPSSAPKSDADLLREIKLELWPKAYRSQDPALLDRLLDDTFRYTDAAGVVTTKADELDWVKKNKLGYDRSELVIERLEIYGTTAIVSALGTVYSKKGELRYRSTNVFIKRDGQWRAIASHISNVSP